MTMLDYLKLVKYIFQMKMKIKLPTEKNILTIGIYGDCDYLDLKGNS